MTRSPTLPRVRALTGRLITAALVPVAFACSTRAGDQPPALATPDSSQRSIADTTRLPRTDVTVADRARWFGRLHWPNACEDDFAKTHLTDDGGLDFHTLEQGTSLVVVRCALGAYQPASTVLLVDERHSLRRATVLEFPTYESLDGKTLAAARTAELVGEVTVLDARNTLTVLSLARQIGDCGTWARYEFHEGTPVLNAFAERVSCPVQPGARANPKPGEPPDGWRSLVLK